MIRGPGEPDDAARVPQEDARAHEELLLETQEELRSIARQQLYSANAHRHKGATSLVHDAVLKLMRRNVLRPMGPLSREHFIKLMRKVMHDELVDFIRHRETAKEGGGWRRVPVLDLPSPDGGQRQMTGEELDDALAELQRVDPMAEHVFVLVQGFDCSLREAGEVAQIGYNEARRCWEFACPWLGAWLTRRRGPS